MSTRNIHELLDEQDDKKIQKVVSQLFKIVGIKTEGMIDKNEFTKFLNYLCDDMGIENLNNEENDLLFQTLDADQSGALDENEIKDWLKKLLNNIVNDDN